MNYGIRNVCSRCGSNYKAVKAADIKPPPRIVESGPREGVRVRMPLDADDFESVTAEWLKACGVRASRTPKGPDGGLDVLGPTFAGQCKFHPSQKIGAPDIQQLAGAARQFGKSQIGFFHYGPGYTAAAITAAQRLGVTLWSLDPRSQTFRRVK